MRTYIKPELFEPDHHASPTWVLKLDTTVERLVSTVGGTLLESHMSAGILRRPLAIGPRWDPDLSLADRIVIEAAALASAQRLTRHRHFFTTSADSSNPNPDNKLALLAALADRLHIDLYCYRFNTFSDETDLPTTKGWYVSFELPSSATPVPRSRTVDFASLAEALSEADPMAMLNRSQLLRNVQPPIPAHFIRDTTTIPTAMADEATVDLLTDRINALAATAGGALAIRRNGSWHYSALEPDAAIEEYRETTTGQIREHRIQTWNRATAIPSPNWWGEQIPDRACPRCETGTTWVPCDCATALRDGPDPLCERCSGSDTRQSTICTWCGTIGRIRYGYSVTVAGLEPDAPVHHFNIDVGADARHQPKPSPEFTELVRIQLPEAARLTSRLFDKGIDLADLRETTGLAPSSALLDAGVTAPEGTPMVDLAHQHVTAGAAGRPGARVLLVWSPPARATALQLARIAWGLGLDLVVGAEDRTDERIAGTVLGGMRWGAALLHPLAEPERSLTGTFGKRRLDIALQACLDHLPHLLNIAASNKPGPVDVVPAPQQLNLPVINRIGELESFLSGLASLHAGLNAHALVARLSPQRTTFVRLTAGTERRLQPVVPIAEAPTLSEALTVLGRPERS